MKTLLKLEELGFVVLAFHLFLGLDYAWWWFLLLFFLPDLSLIGFLINKKLALQPITLSITKPFRSCCIFWAA